MTREELIEELFDLRDCHTVPKKTCEYLRPDLLRNDYHYSAGNDSRVADLLEYLSPTGTDFPQCIDFTAFTIVANISRFIMQVAEEIRKFVTAENPQGILDLEKQTKKLYEQIALWNH